MDITFEQGDERALAFIDTQDIIKHLEQQGYQVIDKSEHESESKKENYFISVVKNHQLGNGSHSWNFFTASACSGEKPGVVLDEMVKTATENLKDVPGSSIQVVAFNKV